jgi:hypothetical protein
MALAGCCGAECSINVPGSTPPAGHERHWTGISGSPAISSSVTRHVDGLSYRFAPVAGSHYLEKSIPAATNTEFVKRTAICFDGLPDVNTQLIRVLTAAGENAGLVYDATAQAISGAWVTAGTPTAGYAVVTGRWYVVDFVAVVNTNPRTIQVRVTDDTTGVTTDLGTASRTLTGSTFTAWRVGCGGLSSQVVTGVVHHDDMAWSHSAADYPIGNGHVHGVRFDRDGTHVVGAVGRFKIDNSTNISGSETDLHTKVNNVDPTSTTTRLTQNVIAAGDYLEFRPPADMSSIGPVASIRCVTAVARMQNESLTATNAITLRLLSGGNADDMVAAASLGFTTPIYFLKGYPTAPGGAAWTLALIQDLLVRFGFGTDIDPIPAFRAMKFEVDVVPATVQKVRPASDVSAGAWTTDTGSSSGLAATVNEVTPSDAEFMQSPVDPSSSAVEIKFANPGTPGPGGGVLRIRIRRA